jgi:hypothetical protein
MTSLDLSEKGNCHVVPDTYPDTYQGTENQFELAMRRLRSARLKAYMASVDNEVHDLVLDAIVDEVRGHGMHVLLSHLYKNKKSRCRLRCNQSNPSNPSKTFVQVVTV